MPDTLDKQIPRFAAIGAIGFVVDGGILSLLHSLGGIDAVSARCVSFPIALLTTWALNRKLTFVRRPGRHAGKELLYYSGVNTIGALINLGLFIVLVKNFESLASFPIAPLAIAALIALLFNFFGTRAFVFGGDRHD